MHSDNILLRTTYNYLSKSFHTEILLILIYVEMFEKKKAYVSSFLVGIIEKT